MKKLSKLEKCTHHPTTERAETTIVEKTREAAKKARYVDEDSDQVIK